MMGHARRLAVWMGAAAAVLACLYAYFLGSITFDIVARKNIEQDIKNLRSELGALELEYLALDKDVTMERAYKLGFRESADTYFAARASSMAAAFLALPDEDNGI